MGPHRIRPVRDAAAIALVVFAVSAAGLCVTYYVAHRAQVAAVQNELLELAQIAATVIDGDAHRRLDAREMDGGAEYLRVLEPLVRVHKAAPGAFYMYTGVKRDGHIYYVLDTATVYRVPEDTSPRVALLQPFDDLDADVIRALETGVPQVSQEFWVEPERRFLSAYAPFFDSHGQLVGVVGVDMWMRDLELRLAGVRRTAEMALAGVGTTSVLAGVVVYRLRTRAALSARRDLQTMRALAEARDAAEQSSRAKSSFLAMMSHELRTPLNAIVGYSELIHDELAERNETQLATDVDRVCAASRHLTSIISDILDYAKIEAGRLIIEPAAVNLAAVLDDVAELMRPSASAKGVGLQLDIRPGLPAALADPVRIRQVLLNLIGNAVKFTEQGTITVRLQASVGRARVVCTVHDTGVGIEPSLQPLLFVPFSQADLSPGRAAGGTGLGLVISRRLTESMGGTLRMRSRPGHGSTFRLSLPEAGAVHTA